MCQINNNVTTLIKLEGYRIYSSPAPHIAPTSLFNNMPLPELGRRTECIDNQPWHAFTDLQQLLRLSRKVGPYSSEIRRLLGFDVYRVMLEPTPNCPIVTGEWDVLGIHTATAGACTILEQINAL